MNTLRRFRRLGRPELVATLCENLPWTTPTGALRLGACRKLFDAIDAAEWMAFTPQTTHMPSTAVVSCVVGISQRGSIGTEMV